MKVESSRFGTLELEHDRVIEFPQGLIGFADYHRYVLLEHAPGSPVHWLQSTELPELALPVVNPDKFVAGYVVQAPAELNRLLGEFTPEDLWLGVVLTIPTEGQPPTINLKAPVILNSRTRLGAQFVLDGDLPVRHPLQNRQ